MKLFSFFYFNNKFAIGKSFFSFTSIVTYLSCVGAAANNASTFTPTAKVTVPSVGNYDLNCTTISPSGVGGPRQSIESIRQNAPISFAAQQRLVTAEDYRAVIQRNYSTVTDAIAWGGEDNVPADFGKVYVSLVFEDGTTEAQKTAVENSIVQDVSNNLSILSIDTVFEDPQTTFLEVIVTFNFDPNLTGQTVKSTESTVFSQMQSYVNNNLKKFGGIFRRSELLGDIDDINDAVLNSRASVKLQQRFIPNLLQSTSYKVYFPVELASSPTDYVVTSSTFIFNDKVCFIRNALSNTKLQIVNSLGSVEIDNIGSYEPLTGTVNITGFAPTAITDGTNYIKLTCTPANESTIKPLRSYILDLDEGASFATSVVDRQRTEITLGGASGVTSSATGAPNTYVSSPSIPSSGY